MSEKTKLTLPAKATTMETPTSSDNIFSEGFNGLFPFTNWMDHDFTAKWNSIAYTFPAQKTSPLIIMGETPEGIQAIRKKFARDLAIEYFYSTDSFKKRNNVAIGENPALYTEAELEPYIQRCLEPLPVASATAKVIKEDKDKLFRRDEKGQRVTKVLDQGETLVNGPVMTD